MNMTQALIILKNGVRKYGVIIDGENNNGIMFIPDFKMLSQDESQFSHLIEHIPTEHIFSIDTCLK